MFTSLPASNCVPIRVVLSVELESIEPPAF